MQPKNPASDFAELTFQKFGLLPKTGKPTKSEWTVLSSIIQVDSANGETKVVSLGCGTKCIGKSKLCPLGLILNDSHAEVLARRGFLRYIYHQFKSKNDLFTFDESTCRFKIKESISFHFFSTQVPCGDACIVSETSSETCDEVPNKRIKLDSDNSNVGEILSPAKVFTGAKLIGETNSDPMHQVQGSLRTKPGRGDRTLSMSCSDKLSKWNILGIQGAFLDMVLEKPIYLDSLSFSCDFDVASMNRAIFGRWKERKFDSKRFKAQEPLIQNLTGHSFEFAQDPKKNASPNGLVWCNVPEGNGPYEISVNGKKQGVTKKLLQTKKSSLKISKLQLLEEFLDLVKARPQLQRRFNLQNEVISYRRLKELSQEYQSAWKCLKESYFQQWTTKPDHLLDFNLSSWIKER